MVRAPKKDCMDDHGVFTDVYAKGIRTPTPNGLDCRKIFTSFCKEVAPPDLRDWPAISLGKNLRRRDMNQ